MKEFFFSLSFSSAMWDREGGREERKRDEKNQRVRKSFSFNNMKIDDCERLKSFVITYRFATTEPIHKFSSEARRAWKLLWYQEKKEKKRLGSTDVLVAVIIRMSEWVYKWVEKGEKFIFQRKFWLQKLFIIFQFNFFKSIFYEI